MFTYIFPASLAFCTLKYPHCGSILQGKQRINKIWSSMWSGIAGFYYSQMKLYLFESSVKTWQLRIGRADCLNAWLQESKSRQRNNNCIFESTNRFLPLLNTSISHSIDISRLLPENLCGLTGFECFQTRTLAFKSVHKLPFKNKWMCLWNSVLGVQNRPLSSRGTSNSEEAST